jgi:tetratricopeptide (TPR) repeat protein
VKQSGGVLVYDSEAVAKALPNSVQLLLHARIDRLKPEDRALLQSASVVGRRFSLDLIGVLTTDAANAFAKLSVMEELDLIYKDDKSDEYVFKHALIRDALYDSLLRQSREVLHLKIAMEIESRSHNSINEVVEVLAHHFYLANETERAFHYMVLAGRKSVGTYSLEEAEYYFKNALNLYDSSSILVGHRDFVELVGNLVHLFNLMFRPNEVKLLVDKYVSDLEKLADSQRLVRILYDYAQATALMCLYRTSVGTAKRMFVIAERLGDDRSLAYARAGLIGATTMFEGLSIEEAERHGQLALIESQRVDDAHLRNIIMVITGWDYLQRGLTDKGRERTMQLQVQGRDTNDPRALGASLWILGWHNIIDERYDEALSCGEECIRVAIAPWDYEIGILVIGVAQIFLGDVDKGSERLWQSRRRGESKEYHHTKAVVDGPLGVAMVLKGDISKGIRFMEAAIERNRKEGNMVATDVARLYLAETLIEILRPKQKPPVNVLLRNLPQLLKLLFIGSKKAIGLLLQARKNPMWTEHTYYRARVDADLGVLYSMNKQIDLARSYLEQARSVANQLAAKALLARIDSALAKLS